MTGQTLPERFMTRIERGHFDRLAELYTDDAVLDAHVPNWRLQVQGSVAIVEQLRNWFQRPVRFSDVKVQQVPPRDLLVRFEWQERDGPSADAVTREMQLWRLAGNRITEQVVFCAGSLDGPLRAKMADETPLVRSRTFAAHDGEATSAATGEAIARFNAAFARHDVDAVMGAMTGDCIFEDTTPPGGGRHEGQAEVRRCWEQLFTSSPDAVFETEEQLVSGDRAIVQWRYRWTQNGGGHVRGVDLFHVRDGKVAAKYSYVKG